MPKSYPPKAPTVKPGSLPDEVLTSIGRLVRACAEIEDILELFIVGLAEINEARAAIFLGKSPISRKLEIASDLAKLRTDEAFKIHEFAFDQDFADFLHCRNVVAHGTFMGIADDGYVFRTNNPGPAVEATKFRVASCFSAEAIHEFARVAEARIPVLEELLQAKVLRAERHRRPLQPRSKARTPKTE